MKKLICAIFILCLFAAVRATNEEGEKTEGEIDAGEVQYDLESECSKAGGICISRVSCPPEKVSHKGHCPKQKHLGVVCCHGLSSNETRCKHLGGHCIINCPEKLIITQATDCEEQKKCCPLTN